MSTKMGFEGLLYYGAAGSTGATLVTNIRDPSITIDADEGDTTVRGTGASPPIATSRVTRLKWSAEWTMLEKTTDTSLEAIKVAAAAGAPIAVRMKDHSAGKGYDGDCNVKLKKGEPIGGEQTWTITVTPNDESRIPQLYV